MEAIEESEAPFTDAHALTETFATLTGFYRVPVAAAAELTLALKLIVTVEPLALADYEQAIGEAQRRGVMGGGIYDSRPPRADFTPAAHGRTGAGIAPSRDP